MVGEGVAGQRPNLRERRQPVERTNERLLGEVPGQLLLPRHAVREAVHAINVSVIQRPLCGLIAFYGTGNELGFGHFVGFGYLPFILAAF